jgi:hypothetical protein
MRIFLLLTLIGTLFNLSSCNLNPGAGALEYNNVIVDEQTKILEMFVAFTELQGDQLEELDKARLRIIDQCTASLKILEGLSDYEGNTRFRDAAIELFRFYRMTCENAYKEMIDILGKGEDITDSDLKRLEEINAAVEAREVILDNALQAAQEEFTGKYNISLQKTEMQDKIDQMNE